MPKSVSAALKAKALDTKGIKLGHLAVNYDPPAATKLSFPATTRARSAVGPFLSLAQRSGTHCQTSSAAHRYRSTVSVASLKHSCLQTRSSVHSALEIFLLMRYTNLRLLTYLLPNGSSSGWPFMTQWPKFKIPLPISFVPRPMEYTCNVLSTQVQQSQSLRVLKMDGRTFDWFLPCDAYAQHGQDVRLSVCHTPVLCLNRYTYPQSFFTIGQPHHSSFSTPNAMAILRRRPP